MCLPRGLYQQALGVTVEGSAIQDFGKRAIQNKRDIGQFMVVTRQLMVWLVCGLGEENPAHVGSLKALSESDRTKLI